MQRIVEHFYVVAVREIAGPRAADAAGGPEQRSLGEDRLGEAGVVRHLLELLVRDVASLQESLLRIREDRAGLLSVGLTLNEGLIANINV